VNAIAFSKDDSLLASAGADSTVRIWSVDTQRILQTMEHGEWVTGIAFGPTGRIVASTGRDREVKLWSVDGGRPLATIGVPEQDPISLAFSNDGLRLVIGCADGRVRILNLKEKKTEDSIRAHSGSVLRLRYSSLGDRLVSSGSDHAARIWQMEARENPIELTGHADEVLYASFSPDDRFIATSSKDGTIRFWESDSGRQLYWFKAHEGAANSVNFSHDAMYLLTAGSDRAVRCWMSDSGRLLCETMGGDDYAAEAVFSHNGDRIASGCGDGTIKMWEVRAKSGVGRSAAVSGTLHNRVVPPQPAVLQQAAVVREPAAVVQQGVLRGQAVVREQPVAREQAVVREFAARDPRPVSRSEQSRPAERHRLDAILSRAVWADASDIHVPSGADILLRKHGALEKFNEPRRSPAETEAMLLEILSDEQRGRFIETNDLDFSYEVDGVARFRANICRQHRGVDGSFRVIPQAIPTPEQLGLPAAVSALTNNHQGLVLITGPAGRGKSTTIASLIDLINSEKPLHIITVEDPIEFVHPLKRAVVNQRELGKHTRSFSNALRAALREDPDVIVVGEMRDLETISLAITAAETGHLVFGSLMTTDASQTVDRILDSFPAGQQAQIRTMLSESLRGIASQQLVPAADGSGRVLACEILLCNLAVGNMIRERKTFQLGSTMQTGRNQGMQRMDDSLFDLFQAGRITSQNALLYSHDVKAMEPRIRAAGTTPAAKHQ
jgi:twitching motility protein PilT